MRLRVTKSGLLAAFGTCALVASVVLFAHGPRDADVRPMTRPQKLRHQLHALRDGLREMHSRLDDALDESRDRIDGALEDAEPTAEDLDNQLDAIQETTSETHANLMEVLDGRQYAPRLTGDHAENKARLQAWLAELNEVLPEVYDVLHEGGNSLVDEVHDGPLSEGIDFLASQNLGESSPDGWGSGWGAGSWASASWEGGSWEAGSLFADDTDETLAPMCDLSDILHETFYKGSLRCGERIQGTFLPGREYKGGDFYSLHESARGSSVAFSTCEGTDVDTVLALYSTCVTPGDTSADESIAYSDDAVACGLQSRFSYAFAGEDEATYYLQVRPFGADTVSQPTPYLLTVTC